MFPLEVRTAHWWQALGNQGHEHHCVYSDMCELAQGGRQSPPGQSKWKKYIHTHDHFMFC